MQMIWSSDGVRNATDLQEICNEFHAHIDWHLSDHKESELPLPEHTSKSRPNDDNENLTPAELVTKCTCILELDKCICRWYKYRVQKLRQGFLWKLDPQKDPWAVILAKLSGLHTSPKARQVFQQFQKEEHRTKIAPVVAARWADEAGAGSNVQTKKEPDTAFRAKTEAQEAHKAYKQLVKEMPSKSPESRNECINSPGTFNLGPILHSIELKTINVLYGRTRTGNTGHFPDWAKERWDDVTDFMKEYLATAFTVQDQAKAVLPLDGALNGAKFTIAPQFSKDDEHNSDEDSASSSDSNGDSDDTQPPRKHKQSSKNKVTVAPAATAPAKKPAAKKKAPPLKAPDRNSAIRCGELWPRRHGKVLPQKHGA
ncbi:hypothetical protein C8R43DRAFT_1128070 [Mycena crocata]|nr:hypothetical protein C8R43DRAFT_1128070 [Mycena crocata]